MILLHLHSIIIIKAIQLKIFDEINYVLIVFYSSHHLDLTFKTSWGRFLVRFSLSKRHIDRSIQLRRSLTPSFCATKSCEKGWRTANRSTFTIEKSTPDHLGALYRIYYKTNTRVNYFKDFAPSCIIGN